MFIYIITITANEAQSKLSTLLITYQEPILPLDRSIS